LAHESSKRACKSSDCCCSAQMPYLGNRMRMPSFDACMNMNPAEPSCNLEDDLDAVGIAKCCQCGIRLPLDDHDIELHSRSCIAEPKSKKWLGVENTSLRNAGFISDGETHASASSGREELIGSACGGMVHDMVGDEDSSCACNELESEPEESGLDDWEDDFDAIGIAKCSHCGMKLPDSDEAVEEHLKICEGEGRRQPKVARPEVQDSQMQQQFQAEFGKCCRCNQRMSLDVEAVVAHSHVCPALIAQRRQAHCSSASGSGMNVWLSQLGFKL